MREREREGAMIYPSTEKIERGLERLLNDIIIKEYVKCTVCAFYSNN